MFDGDSEVLMEVIEPISYIEPSDAGQGEVDEAGGG